MRRWLLTLSRARQDSRRLHVFPPPRSVSITALLFSTFCDNVGAAVRPTRKFCEYYCYVLFRRVRGSRRTRIECTVRSRNKCAESKTPNEFVCRVSRVEIDRARSGLVFAFVYEQFVTKSSVQWVQQATKRKKSITQFWFPGDFFYSIQRPRSVHRRRLSRPGRFPKIESELEYSY